MVDPVSIVVAICGIVSAINSGKELFKSWRARRDVKKGAEDLEKALVQSPARIQGEHDEIVSKLGQRFSRGDRTAIQEFVKARNRFNQTFIQIVQLAIRQNTMLDINSLLGATHNLRDTAISSLHELFHRQQMAAPIPRNPFTTSLSTYSLCLPPYEPSPAYESSAELVNFIPRSTSSSLRHTLDAISRLTPTQEGGNIDRLEARFQSINLSSPSVDKLNYGALPSSTLLQTHIASMNSNSYDDLYS